MGLDAYGRRGSPCGRVTFMSASEDARSRCCIHCGESRFLPLSYTIPMRERRRLRQSDLKEKPRFKCVGCGHAYRSIESLRTPSRAVV